MPRPRAEDRDDRRPRPGRTDFPAPHALDGDGNFLPGPDAQGCKGGRPCVYGVGARGECGVTLCLDIVRKALDMTMAFGRRHAERAEAGTIGKDGS